MKFNGTGLILVNGINSPGRNACINALGSDSTVPSMHMDASRPPGTGRRLGSRPVLQRYPW